jgi:putative SOS response-associated peptidase YedK
VCGRYQLEDDWSDFPEFKVPREFVPNRDVRPTNAMPIVRLDEQGDWFGEMRHWGFLRTWPGPSGKWIKKSLINAVGEELEHKKSFREAFHRRHCVVPMCAWYEWPIVDGKKTRVRIGMKHQRTFGVAGLYETSRHPDSGASVETFTIVTVPPNELLGSAHDRAPLVLGNEQCQVWLEGGPPAKALIGAHPDNDAFFVEPVAPDGAQASLI